ncbi:MAG: putative manganese-dependent inorganic diphosphatase [Coriobacteriia bacterium]|nr:putative manganese-dependent inorganic diphosphatase [Coriobacteriia bacterium]
MSQILVFGHRNPDNDSICSAVGYAHLKNATDPGDVYLPARLGPVPPETEWVFARFGLMLPDEIRHVRTRVSDVMTHEVVSVGTGCDMLEAGALMRERGVRALPVVAEGTVRGIVNERILAERYLDDTAVLGFGAMPVTVGQLAHTLGARVLAGAADATLSGGVLIAAMEPETIRARISPGDTLIVGDRVRTQPMALEAGVACLIVTGGFQPEPAALEIARGTGAAVLATPNDTYATARLINLSRRCGEVMDTSVPFVQPGTLLTEAAEDLFASPHREAVVVDERGAPAGILTRTDLARGTRRRVVLVDHNEYAQSAPGLEEAAVVEIVDHHRVGDVQTSGPVMFLNLPVGSTATIVAMRFRELGAVLTPQLAGVLLSGVLSDTVLLKSPTTTDDDRRTAAWLGGAAHVEPMELGMEMFRARSAVAVFDARRTVTADLKEYHVGESRVAVGQVETVDAADVLAHRAELLAVMEGLAEDRGYDLVLLMVTDVVREGSEILAVGRTKLAERALGVTLAEGSAWMPGVLSRKKQVASRLAEAASR